MKNLAKRTRFETCFMLIGLCLAFLAPFIDLQAQTQESRDSETESTTFVFELVPAGFAVVTSVPDGATGNPTVRILNILQLGSLWTNTAEHSPSFIDTGTKLGLLKGWPTSAFQNQTMHGLTMTNNGSIIYVAASGFVGANRTPNIYQIGPASDVPFLLTVTPLPGARGIGAVDYDLKHGLIFATNLEDGKIYSVNATNGIPFGVHDPLGPDTSGAALPPLEERVIAVAYARWEDRVYYSTWGNNYNTVRSIGLTATGAFKPPNDDKLEFVLPINPGQFPDNAAPVGDIEFNTANKRMLVAENPIQLFSDPLALAAHHGRVLEYIKEGTSWKPDKAVYGIGPPKYEVGRYNIRANARGGVAWVYPNLSGAANGFENFILMTGDALLLSGGSVYGLQFTPASGGSAGGGLLPSNSLIADLDYDVNSQDKFVYCDVDVRRSPELSVFNPGGTVYDISARPIGRARLTMTFVDNLDLGTRTAITNPFGYYNFKNVPLGERVEISISARNYTFSASTVTFTTGDGTNTVDFVADPQE